VGLLAWIFAEFFGWIAGRWSRDMENDEWERGSARRHRH
jgi:hypothetical protein